MGFAGQEPSVKESDELWEVFLSSRVSLSNRVPLHYLGIINCDSLPPQALDTLDRVLTRDLTLSALFNLRLPNFPPDTARKDPLSERMTYLDGDCRTSGDTLRTVMRLRSKVAGEPFWSEDYQLMAERARAVAHRISADVIRQLTGEPSVMQTRIAFCGQRGATKDIFSTTFDGFDLIQHTDHQNTALSPVWSPDGNKIAYTSFLEEQADIYITDLKAGAHRPFCNQPGVDQAPDWSKDGQWIVYSSSVDGNAEIYIRRVDGSETRRLTYSWAIETSPCWSPTGHQIAFTSDRLGRPQVFIMEADGTNQQRLTTEGDYNDSPAWSPRGDLIAYVRRSNEGFQIYVTDPRGEKHVKLTSGPGDNLDPCWSPDGLKIAFTSNRSGTNKIYVTDLLGRNTEIITNMNMPCSNPTWSPVFENTDLLITPLQSDIMNKNELQTSQ